MFTHYTHPKLRWPININVETVENQNILVISCPQGLVDNPLTLVAGVAPIISEFNGQNSIENIANKFSHYGINLALVEELVKLLDQSLFLETPEYYKKINTIKKDFRENPIRKPALAGLSYPATSAELSLFLDGFMANHNKITNNNLIGLVTPHIDYYRGGSCYGKTFSELTNSKHDLFVLLGTAHQYSPHIFHLTYKDFETPISKLDCDIELARQLINAYGEERSLVDEFLHKKEHSLELQTPFLAKLNPNAKILPILVGSFHHMVTKQLEPKHFASYQEFSESLVSVLRTAYNQGRSICFICGVDMAHMGQYFGDKEKLTPKLMEQIAERDRQYLELIEKQDKAGLFAHIAEDADARKICGYPSVYLLLDILENLKIKSTITCIDYQQAVNYKNDCAVTFAGLKIEVINKIHRQAVS